MGLYDYLRCEYPLPDRFDAKSVQFQTKDTSRQYLESYTLREDGTLWVEERDFDEEGRSGIPVLECFHGALNFYASNLSGCSSLGYTTTGDAPWWSRDYTALFDRGKLLRIDLNSADVVPRGKHLKHAEFWVEPKAVRE